MGIKHFMVEMVLRSLPLHRVLSSIYLYFLTFGLAGVVLEIAKGSMTVGAGEVLDLTSMAVTS
jgi:hypothetical protein